MAFYEWESQRRRKHPGSSGCRTVKSSPSPAGGTGGPIRRRRASSPAPSSPRLPMPSFSASITDARGPLSDRLRALARRPNPRRGPPPAAARPPSARGHDGLPRQSARHQLDSHPMLVAPARPDEPNRLTPPHTFHLPLADPRNNRADGDSICNTPCCFWISGSPRAGGARMPRSNPLIRRSHWTLPHQGSLASVSSEGSSVGPGA